MIIDWQDYQQTFFVVCPGWKRKAFFGENAFFLKLETRPAEALCGF